ncbi:unnamed protein product [Somion occarium]|uniref:Uncharacterized protein n=1 Tax=Somion occarium TaxID=3059160 RepID=A0ABP1DHQ5_9APHY
MFSSSPTRTSSRFGAGDLNPLSQVPAESPPYRVPLHPSMAFDVSRHTVSDYNFYLVPTSSPASGAKVPPLAPVLSADLSPTSDFQHGQLMGPRSRIISKTTAGQTSRTQPPRVDLDPNKQRELDINSAREPSFKGHPDVQIYDTYLHESDAMEDLAPSDYHSDTSFNPIDHSSDGDSYSESDGESSAGSSSLHEGVDSADESPGNFSHIGRSRLGLRLPVTSMSGDDIHVFPDNNAQFAAQRMSKDVIPRDTGRVKREQSVRLLASVPAAAEQTSPVRVGHGIKATTSASLDFSKGPNPSSNFLTGESDDPAAVKVDPHIWSTWNINSWKSIPTAQGYSLSMPRPYPPLQFTNAQLRHVVEKHPLPDDKSSICRTSTSVDTFSTWDAFRAEYLELCKALNFPQARTAQDSSG